MERTGILVDNFKESVRQIHSYLFWAYVLNVTMLWLMYHHREMVKGNEKVSLPPLPIAMDTVTAELVALVISIGLGYAIFAVAANGLEIVKQLAPQPDTVIALFTYPTISTTESTFVRWTAFMVPPAMLMASVIIDATRSSTDVGAAVGGLLILFGLGAGPYARAAGVFHDLVKFRRVCEHRINQQQRPDGSGGAGAPDTR